MEYKISKITNNIIILKNIRYNRKKAIPIDTINMIRLDNNNELYLKTEVADEVLKLDNNFEILSKVVGSEFNKDMNLPVIRNGWIIYKYTNIYSSTIYIGLRIRDIREFTHDVDNDCVNIIVKDLREQTLEHDELNLGEEHVIDFMHKVIYRFKCLEQADQFFNDLIEAFNHK